MVVAYLCLIGGAARGEKQPMGNGGMFIILADGSKRDMRIRCKLSYILGGFLKTLICITAPSTVHSARVEIKSFDGRKITAVT